MVAGHRVRGTMVSGSRGASSALHVFALLSLSDVGDVLRSVVACYSWLGELFSFIVFCGADIVMLWVLLVWGWWEGQAGHDALSPYKWVNTVIGVVLHTIVLVPYFSWRITHRTHHVRPSSFMPLTYSGLM